MTYGPDVLPIPSSTNAFRSEHRELPGAGSFIVADEIRITVCASQLEIPVVGCQPGVQYFRDGYPTVTKNQHSWRLLAPMACVALDTDTEEPLFRYLIHRTMLAWFCAEGDHGRRPTASPRHRRNFIRFWDRLG